MKNLPGDLSLASSRCSPSRRLGPVAPHPALPIRWPIHWGRAALGWPSPGGCRGDTGPSPRGLSERSVMKAVGVWESDMPWSIFPHNKRLVWAKLLYGSGAAAASLPGPHLFWGNLLYSPGPSGCHLGAGTVVGTVVMTELALQHWYQWQPHRPLVAVGVVDLRELAL